MIVTVGLLINYDFLINFLFIGFRGHVAIAALTAITVIVIEGNYDFKKTHSAPRHF